jgi:hypothetical protein
MKLITEILNEEIKIFEHASMSTWETDPSWSSVASRRPLNKSNARQPNSYRDTQPIESINRYAILTNIPETSILQGKKEPKMTKSTCISTNNYFQKETHRRIRNPLPNPPPRYTTQEEPRSEQNSIPTFVNGQIKPNKTHNSLNRMNNRCDHIHNLVRESAIKVLNTKAKYTKSTKHKVLLIGDSHIRGSAASLIASLDSCFEMCSVVKPGSNTETLVMTAKSDMEALTKKDFLIICSGTSDIDRNSSKNALKNIINVIKNINQTNIIIVNVPHRYDVTVHPHINSSIKFFNSQLLKLTNRFNHISITEIESNRVLFTKHGLHLNKLGKELLSNQLVLCILSTLKRINGNSIPLTWYDKKTQVDAPTKNRPSPPLTPNNDHQPAELAPTRTKKLPITRIDDFLQGI